MFPTLRGTLLLRAPRANSGRQHARASVSGIPGWSSFKLKRWAGPALEHSQVRVAGANCELYPRSWVVLESTCAPACSYLNRASVSAAPPPSRAFLLKVRWETRAELANAAPVRALPKSQRIHTAERNICLWRRTVGTRAEHAPLRGIYRAVGTPVEVRLRAVARGNTPFASFLAWASALQPYDNAPSFLHICTLGNSVH